MADWIHCNKCFVRYRASIKFFVTTCGHLSCENCASKTAGDKCHVCKSSCQYIILNNDLKPEMQFFFRSQSDVLEKTKQVCMFQELNKSALLKNVTDKYLITKSELMKCYKALQDSRKEVAKLKTFLKNLTGQNYPPITSSSGHIFPSPSQSVASSNYSNAHNLRGGTPFMYPSNQGSRTSWNSRNTPNMMAYRQHPNTSNSFGSFQTSLPDTTLDGSQASMGDLNPRNPRPSAMMPISKLNLGGLNRKK